MASAPVAQAIVAFSASGAFPEEDVSSTKLRPEHLPSAIQALTEAKSKLESEIHTINEETGPDVAAWRANANSVQDDIVKSKALANEIVRRADAPDVSGKAIQDTQAKAEFLAKELSYNQQLREALAQIKAVGQTLDQVEQACRERRILDALHLLEKSWSQLDFLPVSKSCRVVKLLDIRAFELKSDVHQILDHVWNTLVHVDQEKGVVSISDDYQGEPISLSDAVIGLQAYKEVDERTKTLWHDIDHAVVGPRMDLASNTVSSIQIQNNVLEKSGTADKAINSLFKDLEHVFRYLLQRLPPEMVESISGIMMPEVVSRITTTWLDSAVPYSLKELDAFEEVVQATRDFCASLQSLGLSGFRELQDWVDSAPRIWLGKCREAALDSVRTGLAAGLGESKQVERVEKQMVSRVEKKELTANTSADDMDDHGWDAAWSDSGNTAGYLASQHTPPSDEPAAEDDGTDAWGWGDDDNSDGKPEAQTQQGAEPQETAPDEDDPSEAWGWGEEEQNQEARPEVSAPTSTPAASRELQTQELVLKEKYNISSMPEPVLSLIQALVEDGAALTGSGYQQNPIAAAAAGFFNIPTLVLAMFRAVSPYYYSLDMGGNMYLYNDATYLAERLSDFASDWKIRDDIDANAKAMLRLDNDIKSLRAFATRAYTNDMSTQKVVLRDLLGGEQNLLQQDEAESCVDAAVARVRSMAATWEDILARSVWYQAVGSLADSLSSKLISDVMEMPSIGQEEAYNIAKLIATVTELDDLFLPSRVQGGGLGGGAQADADEVPSTAQHASSWLRLKYLSEVLQSNLRDVRYLWLESELSLYFSIDEVVDLINLSFEDNPRTREVIREITRNPHPRGTGDDEGW